MTKYKGWLPDIPDFRDYIYSSRAVVVSEVIDLRSVCSTIEHQMSIGSCTAQAIVGMLECIENSKRKSYTDLSRLFVYYYEREIEGTIHYDSGAYLRDGIKVLKNKGVCDEVLWPYDINRYKECPPIECTMNAQRRKITQYMRITNLNDKLQCLAEGFPFVFGAALYSSFDTDITKKTGVIPMPQRSEEFLGGHAMCCVGADMIKRNFIIRNSWGKDWGDNGYCYMPFDYLNNDNLSNDFWTIRS
jgi:C1A family cysteine protease